MNPFMKMSSALLGVLLAVGIGASAGCKKNQPEAELPPPMIVEGVSVDLPRLMNSVVVSGNARAQAGLREVQGSFRYGQYGKAMAGLDKVAKGGGLNDEQKKLAEEVIEELRQVIAKAGPVRKQ